MQNLPIRVYPEMSRSMTFSETKNTFVHQPWSRFAIDICCNHFSLLNFTIQILFDFFQRWKFSLLKFIAAYVPPSAAAGLFDQKVVRKTFAYFQLLPYFNNYKHFIWANKLGIFCGNSCEIFQQHLQILYYLVGPLLFQKYHMEKSK